MRTQILLIPICILAMLISACTTPQPQPQPAAPKETAPAPQVVANLGQVMRGILFTNSNVVFAAQLTNPKDIKQDPDPTTTPNPLASTYGGWTAVENSSLALAEAANLLTIPGRKCANGRDVPIQNADWPMLVQGLRDAGMKAYKAAQSKNQDNILDAADTVTQACASCHDKYREKPGGDKDRCM